MEKPGWKTSEFWLSLAAMVVGLLLASGVIADETVLKVLGVAASALAAMGYTAGRVLTKGAENKARVLLTAAKAQPPDPQ